MGVGDGVAVQAVRQRGARQERLHEGPAALPLQGLRAQLHRHPAARHAAAGQGHGGGGLPAGPPHGPHPPPRGMPPRVKVTAVPLYLSGLSMDRTAKLLGVSTPSVMTWIERFAEVHAQKPGPEGRALVIELDEMWHFLKKVEQALGLEGSGSCYRASGRLGMRRS